MMDRMATIEFSDEDSILVRPKKWVYLLTKYMQVQIFMVFSCGVVFLILLSKKIVESEKIIIPILTNFNTLVYFSILLGVAGGLSWIMRWFARQEFLFNDDGITIINESTLIPWSHILNVYCRYHSYGNYRFVLKYHKNVGKFGKIHILPNFENWIEAIEFITQKLPPDIFTKYAWRKIYKICGNTKTSAISEDMPFPMMLTL